MSLHDACHSIDSPDIGAILEIVKFPNSSERRTAMTVHPTSFPTDQPVHPADAEALLPVAAAPQVHAAKQLNLRKLLLTGAAIAARAARAPEGWDSWTPRRHVR